MASGGSGNGSAGNNSSVVIGCTTYTSTGGGLGRSLNGPGTDGGPGGSGGGGAGGNGGQPTGCYQNGTSGTANTGGGGGGAGRDGVGGQGSGGAGGSGIVVIRGPSAIAFAGSPCCAFTGSTHPGGDKIAKFTATGTLTISLA